MNADDLRSLIEYNYWANARIWRAMLQVTPEQFVAKNTSSYGSLRGTLVHTLFAETLWRRRLQGEHPTADSLPREADFATPQALYAAWLEDEKAMRAFAAGLTDEFVQAAVHYKTTHNEPFANLAWNILAHVVNHGTQHRAEAAAMLKGDQK